MNSNVKSATTAGLLGIFLGGVGAHNWYLGDKKKGQLHVIIFGVGLGLSVLAGGILPTAMSWRTLLSMEWLLTLLSSAGWLAIAASEVWGFVEGIQILTAGDAALARRGYTVAQPFNQSMGNQNMGNGNMGNPNMGGQNFGTNQSGNQFGNQSGNQMNNSNPNMNGEGFSNNNGKMGQNRG